MICPVCKMWASGEVCGTCGFDASKIQPWFLVVMIVLGLGILILASIVRELM